MKKTLLASFVVLSLAACSSADNKVPQISADFCDCFKKLDAGLSAESKKIFTTAANADDPEKVLTEEILKLDEETQAKVGGEMTALSEIENENSELGGCLKTVEKKYDNQYTFNEKKFAEKIIKELESKQGCSFTASLMKLGIKSQEKGKK